MESMWIGPITHPCKNILQDPKNASETRIRFFNTVEVPVLTYGDEARVMTQKFIIMISIINVSKYKITEKDCFMTKPTGHVQ